jgi:hypothetical protein
VYDTAGSLFKLDGGGAAITDAAHARGIGESGDHVHSGAIKIRTMLPDAIDW